MPTRGSRAELLVDTSVAVALVVADHAQHASTTTAIDRRVVGLAGHAAFETFSVLTRLPAPHRRSPQAVSRIIATDFPATRQLSARASAALLARVADIGLSGGSVYDALVGAAAAEHGLPLATRDRRAVETYRSLGVEVELLA
jgi:predicted nucleic acid-binding protein